MLIFLLFSDQISGGGIRGANCLRRGAPVEESQYLPKLYINFFGIGSHTWQKINIQL